MADKDTPDPLPSHVVRSDADMAAADEPKTSYSIQTLVLGLRVLDALVHGGRGKGVSELARELGTTKWRVFRHLHTLCEEGYAVQDKDTDKFHVGHRVYGLIGAIPARFGFVHESRPESAWLCQERGHTVVVASLVDDCKVMVVDTEVGRRSVQYVLRVGTMFDLHATAHGKIAMAFGHADLLERVIERGLTAHTPHTITDPDRLRREVERARRRGWAQAPEEAYTGLNTLVAPILSVDGKYEGSIGIFGSVEHIPPEPDPDDIAAVITAARRISSRLGWK